MTSLNILLVEDNLPLAKSTAKLIERLGGHSVQITDEPQTIFELCSQGKVDIILMDINLSGAVWEGEEISGADLSRLLKASISVEFQRLQIQSFEGHLPQFP